MKRKTIKKILTSKLSSWFESIEDETVRELARKNTIVTGGCIASMLLSEKVNDYDIYFRNRETAFEVANYYIARFHPREIKGIPFGEIILTDAGSHGKPADKSGDGRIKIMIKSAGIASEDGTTKPYEYFESAVRSSDAGEYVAEVMQDPGDIAEAEEQIKADVSETEKGAAAADSGKPKFRPIFLSSNAITLSDSIQIVIRFWGEPDEIHANYDFAHCTSYYDSGADSLVLRPEALEALLARELRYIGSKYPVCSLFRLRKFLSRGWTVNTGQILKIVMQISALDLTQVDVLEDQLIGVDVAYFYEVIRKLKDKDPLKVNTAYLIEIIDRMF